MEARAGEAPADEPDVSPVPDIGVADPPDAPVAPEGFADDAVAFDIAMHGIDVVVVLAGEVVDVVADCDVVEVVGDVVVEVVEVGVDDVVVVDGVVEVVADEVSSHGTGDVVEVADVVEVVSFTDAAHAAAGSNTAAAPASVTARTPYLDRHRCTALLSSVGGRFQ